MMRLIDSNELRTVMFSSSFLYLFGNSVLTIIAKSILVWDSQGKMASLGYIRLSEEKVVLQKKNNKNEKYFQMQGKGMSRYICKN